MRAAVRVWYLQALASNTGLKSSGQEYTLSGRQGDMADPWQRSSFLSKSYQVKHQLPMYNVAGTLEGSLKVTVYHLDR